MDGGGTHFMLKLEVEIKSLKRNNALSGAQDSYPGKI